MSKSTHVPNFIHPDYLYDYSEAARILKRTPEWLKKHFILTGKVDVIPAGQTYWILGYALIGAVRELQTRYERATTGLPVDADTH